MQSRAHPNRIRGAAALWLLGALAVGVLSVAYIALDTNRSAMIASVMLEGTPRPARTLDARASGGQVAAPASVPEPVIGSARGRDADSGLLQTIADQQASIQRLQSELAAAKRETQQLQPQIAEMEQQVRAMLELVRQSNTSLVLVQADLARVAAASSSARSAAPPHSPAAQIAVAAEATRQTLLQDGAGQVVACTVVREGPGQTSAGIVLQFDKSKDALNSSHYKMLADLAEQVLRCPGTALEVKGFSDGSGSPDLKLQISQRRADLTAKFLESHGVRRDQLQVVAMSDREPRGDNDSDEGRARNRRVEVRLKLVR